MVYPLNEADLYKGNTHASDKLRVELSLKCDSVPKRMQHLFLGKINTLLTKPLNDKIKGLISVYTLNDQIWYIHFFF